MKNQGDSPRPVGRRTWVFFVVGTVLVGSCPVLHGQDAVAVTYDLVIRQAEIVDGTGNPGYQGDIGIRGDRIAAVGRWISGKGKHEIDGDGLVASPGFIDIHSHSEWLLLEDGHAQSKIRQGVTTEILGEGSSPGPFEAKLHPKTVMVNGASRRITSLEGYFTAIKEATVSVNVASYVGLGNVWRCVMGDSHAEPSLEHLKAMQALVDTAMQQGALGLSSQLMMPPGLLATTDQVVALASRVRPYGGIYSSHIRNEGLGVFEAVRQAIEIGERAGVPVDIIHFKIADQKFWGRMDELIDIIEAARERGVDVQANVYPYTRGNNNLASIIPPWAHEGGRLRMMARLDRPAQRERMKVDILRGLPGWYNHYTAVGGDWARMLVSGNNQYQGMTMEAVMAKRLEGKPNGDALEELFDILIEEGGSVGTVYAHHTEEDMTLALQQPWCSVGSDGSAYATAGELRRGHPHPRNFGTFPRVLGRYVREQGVLRLEDAIRKMTSLNAAKVGLRRRGLLKEGFYADITLFDPDKVMDRATFTEPFHYSQGIEYVLVNGELVLAGSLHTGKRPGRALRPHR